jgi:hypothetical protein
LRFSEGLVDEGKSQRKVSEKLSAKADAELFAEGGGLEEAERYRLAGETWVFAAGLWHHAMRRRQSGEINPRRVHPKRPTTHGRCPQ